MEEVGNPIPTTEPEVEPIDSKSDEEEEDIENDNDDHKVIENRPLK